MLWCAKDTVFWIDIDDNKAWPQSITIEDIESQLISRDLIRIDDPCVESTLREVDEGSVHWEKRENAWNAIKDEIDNPELFYSAQRGKAVRRIMERSGITHQTANRLIRRYWQRGMCKNALLPDYNKSGGAGKKRNPNNKKLGRPRSTRSGIGSNITPDYERIFRQVIEAKLLNQKYKSVTDAHASALNLIKATNPNLTPFDVPTVEQFRYFYKREYDDVTVLKKQTHPTEFAKDKRPIMGTSTADTLGPGYRYQIDATIGDIYLLAEHDRSKIVGRPVVYVVKDVFSRMITGLYVGFEGPSWVSAMMALANTIENKVEYCRQFDVEINESDWAVQGLPDVILADKGELNGTKAHALCEAFAVEIANAPARRGDAKGIVERYFRTVQDQFKPYVAGVVEPELSKKRGGHDYRQDATMTLSKFTEMIIYSVLWHNNHQTLSKYDRCESMPTHIPAVPIHLWNWGIANLTGKLRTAPKDLVRVNLMPHDVATLSDVGFCLFGCFYTCSEALKLGWFHRMDGARPEKVLVSYDPRNAERIYLRPNNSLKDYWVCELTERSRRFRGMTFWDVWAITREERKADADAKLGSAFTKGELLEKVESISAKAELAKPDKQGLSQKDLGMQIRNNKQAEKAQERQRTAFKLGSTKVDKSQGKVIPFNGESEEDYAFPDMSNLLFEDDDEPK
ncbi:transposase [Pseudoalteromonas sp. HM-SA03]|nr:transposase [Pseudoalteromonas sp. HM-SA03]